MLLAVNYSAVTSSLLQRGAVTFDSFKVPAWPDLAARARAQHPTYVHFPLIVGTGIGGALDGETNAPADWGKVERLLSETDTRYVNVHLCPAPEHAPAGFSPDSIAPDAGAAVIEQMLADLYPVIARFGAENVIAENDQYNAEQTLRAAYLPGVIRTVIEQSGCGLLLDTAHARIAAATLGIPFDDYLDQLPLDRVRDMHVTGVQRVNERWLDQFRAAGASDAEVEARAGQLQDHLPMTEPDWDALRSVLDRVREGRMGVPRTATFEYGGVGPLWEAFTDEAMLQAQIPRLLEMVRSVTQPSG